MSDSCRPLFFVSNSKQTLKMLIYSIIYIIMEKKDAFFAEFCLNLHPKYP